MCCNKFLVVILGLLYRLSDLILVIMGYVIPNYAVAITHLAQIIVPWAFMKNHRLTYGLTSNFSQTPTTQALARI